MCKRSNRVARLLAHALLEWILIALLLASGVFSYLIARFAAFCGLPPPCALSSRLGVPTRSSSGSSSRSSSPTASSPTSSPGSPPSARSAPASASTASSGRPAAGPLRRVLCDGHAADMCEDCGAASGKALLSWMRRIELGERDLACACCGVALESGFYSPPFLLPRTASGDLDCGYSRMIPWRLSSIDPSGAFPFPVSLAPSSSRSMRRRRDTRQGCNELLRAARAAGEEKMQARSHAPMWSFCVI